MTTIDVTYHDPDHTRFVRDMRKAGLDVRLYDGRFFWHGPAVDSLECWNRRATI